MKARRGNRLPVLKQVGGRRREKKKTRRNTGVKGRTRDNLNTTADEAARLARSRVGLRNPQCEVAVWICWWYGVGVSGVGAEGRAQSLWAPLTPNTEAPEGWAVKVCGEAGGWVAGQRAGVPAAAGTGGVACRLLLAPRHGTGQGAGLMPEYKLEREREKTLRQH